MSSLKRLELRCFGAPTALVDGAEPAREVLWRKNLGLLIYLALAPDRRSLREHLSGLFWAESPQEQANRSLNSALNRLRGSLGEGRLHTVGEAVVLEDRDLDVDALRFVRLIERSP